MGKNRISSVAMWLLATVLVVGMAACNGVAGGPNGDPDPTPDPAPPTVTEVLSASETLTLDFMDGVRLEDLDWDRETLYDTTALNDVFGHYEAILLDEGFELQGSLRVEAGETKGNYLDSATGITAELEVESKRGMVEAELSLEHEAVFSGFAEASVTSFLGLEVPYFDGAELAELEWELDFEHPRAYAAEAYDFYGGALEGAGWEFVVDYVRPNGDRLAMYEQDGVLLRLKVEADGDVEIWFNKVFERPGPEPEPEPTPDPGTPPADTDVFATANTLEFGFMDGVRLKDLDWDRETVYDTADFEDVFDEYEVVLEAAGFVRQGAPKREGNEIEAEYTNSTAGMTAELEVELKSGQVEAELSLERDSTFTDPAEADVRYFLGVSVPFYNGATRVNLEWELEFEHPRAYASEAYDFYGGVFEGAGWELVGEAENESGDRLAMYELNDVRTLLKVETDGDVEIAFNKKEFYR